MTHECMWPGCTRRIPAERWGCGQHWAMLPNEIKSAIWAAYVEGQTIETMSAAYRKAIVRAHGWVIETFGAVEENRDPGRWARLVRLVREKDAARRARREAR